ncbi:MAG: membrane-bound lytic murein transglycosylase MltF [Steroidobacteraceae bacterium]
MILRLLDPKPVWPALCACAALALLPACRPRNAPDQDLSGVNARGVLRFATLVRPHSYYVGAHGPEGIEYLLARNFAENLGVDLEVLTYSDSYSLQRAVARGDADIGGAQLTAEPPLTDGVQATAPYDFVPQLIVYRRGSRSPRGIAALDGRHIAVPAASYQLALLRQLRSAQLPKLSWQEFDAPHGTRHLEVLHGDRLDLALIDANVFAFVRTLYRDISVAFPLDEQRPVQWFVALSANRLRERIESYFIAIQTSGLLAQIVQRSVPGADDAELSPLELRADVLDRLPQLRPLFEQAAGENQLDWRLLAAVAYQESRWREDAVSPDGARGIMMLMPATARQLGVDDVFNIGANVKGGARYLAQLRDRLPARIAEPDRSWLALAAYNVGFGHLEDARVITQMRGGNPDRWQDVRTNLPLLARERWHTRVRRGYARGWEPVQYVDRIRRMLDVLEWYSTQPRYGESTG